MSDISIQIVHWLLFAASLGAFATIMRQRWMVMSKAKKSQFPMQPLWGKMGASFVNFWLQVKLYRYPLRGFAHGIMFYAFCIYAIHSLSQMVAGVGWLALQAQGINPYEFSLIDYLELSSSAFALSPTLLWLGLAFITVAIAVIAKFFATIQIRAKNSVGNIGLQGSPLLQWGAILTIAPLFTMGFLLILTNGREFYDAVLYSISLLVFVAIAIFAIRRWFLHADGLDVPSQQSFIILFMIAILMLSTIGTLSTQTTASESSGLFLLQTSLSQWLAGSHANTSSIRTASAEFFWWLHLATVYAFLMYIPLSKHAHLFFAPFNYFFTQKRKPGELSLLDLGLDAVTGDTEDTENTKDSATDDSKVADSFGAKDLHEFSWTSILDSLSCIECGRCTVQCPAHRTGKLLDPKKIMTDLKAVTMDPAVIRQSAAAGTNGNGNGHNGGTGISAAAVLHEHISEEEIWACTACNACVEACPVGNNQLDAIIEMRRHLVLNEGSVPVELQGALNNLEKQANPWGIAAETRSDWCKDLNVQTIAENPQAEVLYWVGCAAAFDERNRKIARSFVKIMQEAKVDFAILGNEEKCTGDSARRAGNEYLYQTLAKDNIQTLQKYDVKKIVTACPHCLNTLGNEYKQLGGDFQVEHHSEYISQLLKEKKIHIEKEKQMKSRRLTYHDSCYLGRMNEIYKEPRKILTQSLGNSIMEAKDHGRNSMCCGAGGAQMWMEEKHTKVNHERSKQLISTGADTIATACPFCMTMISDGVKNEEMDTEISVVDVAEVVAAGIRDSRGKEAEKEAEDGNPLQQSGFAKNAHEH